MADAGRFITKWLTVIGKVRMVGGSNSEGLALNLRFAGMVTVFLSVTLSWISSFTV